MLDMWVTAGVEINPSKPSTVSHESNISIVSTSDSFHLVAVHNLWYLYSYQNCGKPFDIMSVVARLVHCFRFYFFKFLLFCQLQYAAFRMGHQFLLFFYVKSWSNLTPNGSFKICLSWQFKKESQWFSRNLNES